MLNHLLAQLGVENPQEWIDVVNTAGRIMLILIIAWLVLGLSRRLIKIFKSTMRRQYGELEKLKRVDTLSRVFRYTASVIVTIVAGMLILNQLGISIAPILATAGVAGIAIGFGAQSLIKDYFNGFFLLLEDQVREGDVIEAAGKSGLVEEVTLRYVRLRDYDGDVHYVPNGSITTVTNRSRGFAFAVIDAGVAYREDVDAVIDVMREVGAALRADAAFGARILDALEVAGVQKLADSAVVIRVRFKVAPHAQWDVRREYQRRLKKAFDERGIEFPLPHLTVYASRPGEQVFSPQVETPPASEARRE